MSDSITTSQVVERMLGGTRTDEEIARDGARRVVSEIAKLRRQLDQAERAAQHVISFGREQKNDDAIWRRVRRAADKLLDGMPI